jgi:NAD(P)-dependent dehydrogenase (short-subunit alcohol dehydrogenase family)
MNRATKALVRAANRLSTTPIGVGSLRHAVPGLVARPAELHRAIAGKTVLITGASSGIGAATARTVGAAGATVLLVARRGEELRDVRDDIERLGGTAAVYVCDLTDFDALDALAETVLAEHGRVDVLVNNAGMSIRRKVDRSAGRFHDLERQMRLNYFAAVRLVLALLPSMRERRDGHVVTISTWAVQVRPARFSGYAASKAALEAWLDCVSAEAAPDGVAFTTIRMPLVRTPMITPTKAYRRAPAISAEEAAAVVAEAIVHRPRRLRPPISQALALSEAFSARSVDRIRRRFG